MSFRVKGELTTIVFIPLVVAERTLASIPARLLLAVSQVLYQLIDATPTHDRYLAGIASNGRLVGAVSAKSVWVITKLRTERRSIAFAKIVKARSKLLSSWNGELHSPQFPHIRS